MVPCHRLTALDINRRPDAIAGLQPVGPDLDSMPDRLTLRLNVDDTNLRPLPAEPAGVGGLPAALGVEGGLCQEHVGGLRLAGDREDVGDGRFRLQLVVADEPTGASGQWGSEAARGNPASVALALHQRGHGL